MNKIDTRLNASGNKPIGRHIFDILKRQRLKIILSFLSVLLVTIVISIAIPTEYRSIATILIEDYEIPKAFLPSSITKYAEKELPVISQQIMTRAKLAEIIGKFRLYPEFQDKLTFDEIAEEMRKDIKVEFINAEKIDPNTTGGRDTATIVFNLSYGGKNPSRVQEVATYLTELFLEENLKRSSEEGNNRSPFIKKEIEDYQKNLALIDKEVSRLKEADFDKLPETTNILKSIDRLDRELSSYNNSIKTLYERRTSLEGELSILTSQSDTTLSDNEKLDNLRDELIRLGTKYPEGSPEIIKKKDAIMLLEDTIKNKQNYSEKKLKLEMLKDMYEKSEEEAVKEDIKTIEDEIEGLKETGINEGRMIDSKDAPSYLSLKTQITQVDIEIRGAEKERSLTQEKISAYQLKSDSMPKIAQEYISLLRDRSDTEAKLYEAKYKLKEANLSEDLETTQGGAFVILDPPVLPEEPYKSKRLTIFAIGTVLAVGTSIGVGLLSDMLTGKINSKGRGSSKLKDPGLVTPGDIKIKRKKMIAIFISVLALFSIVFILLKIFIMPLDLLWIKIIRKIDKFIIVTLN